MLKRRIAIDCKVLRVVTLVGWLFVGPASSQVLFACKQPDGSVRVQSTACDGQTVGQVKRPLTVNEEADAREERRKAKRAAAAAAEAEKKRVFYAQLAELEKAHPPGPSRLKDHAPESCADPSMIGTTADDLSAMCGTPIHKNITGTRAGSREQWVYSNSVYLYVENGRMTSYQKTN